MEKYLLVLLLMVILYTGYTSFQTEAFTSTTAPITETVAVDESNAINILAKIARDLQEGAGLKVKGDLSVDQNVSISGILNASKINSNTNITGNVSINGNLVVSGSNNFLPIGCVIAWSGSLAAIPYGWKLCDGLEGRPDLTGRFIVGAGKPTGDVSINPNNLLFGTNGGEQQHKLTTPEMPAHTHEGSWGLGCSGGNCQRNGGGFAWSSSYNNPSTGSITGGDLPHNNMPPYYVLYWIIKTI